MEESEIAKLLSSVPLFTQIEHHELELVAARMKEVHFEPGRVIAKQGDSGVGFHLIVDGEAEVSGEGVPRHSMGAGGYFGEIGLIDGGVRSATVTASSDLTTLALVSWDFQPLLDNPVFAKGLLMGLCRLVRDYRESAAGT
ncbi:MAG TPA: cyclic nucleotide-binding domain-containing protein [Actinomycetota bacterium]|jgi:CRP-like cAMP-binding protein|nr:cyclic nucleotide-binding domain-containing protein [Actinomycetota bacterium]